MPSVFNGFNINRYVRFCWPIDEENDGGNICGDQVLLKGDRNNMTRGSIFGKFRDISKGL